MTTRLGDYAMRASINGWAVFQLCPHNMSSRLTMSSGSKRLSGMKGLLMLAERLRNSRKSKLTFC